MYLDSDLAISDFLHLEGQQRQLILQLLLIPLATDQALDLGNGVSDVPRVLWCAPSAH